MTNAIIESKVDEAAAAWLKAGKSQLKADYTTAGNLWFEVAGLATVLPHKKAEFYQRAAVMYRCASESK